MLRESQLDGPYAGVLGDGEVRALLRAAGRAPSSHNSQPWRLRWAGGAVEVHGDPGRALLVSDPDHRELRVACGAAVANVRVAARAQGRRVHTELLPSHRDPWYLGRVRPRAPAAPTPTDVALATAVDRRRTDRGPLSGDPVPLRLRGELARVAHRERCWLVFPDADELSRLRALTRAARHSQAADPAFHDESPSSDDSWRVRDVGLPATAGGDDVDGLVSRRPSVEEEPAVAVVSTFTDSPLAQLQAGQATQYVLLGATVAGLSASFVAAPLEVPDVRREVRALLGHALWPQVVLRLGYARTAQW